MAIFDAATGQWLPDDKLPTLRGNPIATQAPPIEGQATRISGLLQGGSTAGAEGAAGSAGRGLLSRLGGAVFGPVGVGVQAAVMPGQLDNGERGMSRISPEEAMAANQAAQGVSQRVLQNARGVPGLATDLGIMGGIPATNVQATDGAAVQPQGNPAAADMSQRRSIITRGAYQQLQDNNLSRPEAAKAVVEADIQRTGQDLSDKEKAARVKEETKAMRGMDNESLSKYLGWALVGAGLIASAVDDTGMAGEQFAGSFNKQLDRNQQLEMFEAEARAKAEANAAKNALEERKIANKERDTDSNINYQQRRLGQYDDANDLAKAAEARRASTAAASLGIQGQGLLLRQQELKAANADRAAQLDISRKRLENQIADTQSKIQQRANGGDSGGVTLSDKSSDAIAKDFLKSQGIDPGKGVLSTFSGQIKNAVKSNPRAFQENPKAVLGGLLNSPTYKATAGKKGLVWNDNPKIEIK